LTSQFLDGVEAEAQVLIRALEQVDAAGFFQQIAKGNDRQGVWVCSDVYVSRDDWSGGGKTAQV